MKTKNDQDNSRIVDLHAGGPVQMKSYCPDIETGIIKRITIMLYIKLPTE